MKVKEYLLANDGFFTHISDPDFNGVMAEDLDTHLIIKFGERIVAHEKSSAESISKYCFTMFKDKWKLLEKMSISEFDLLNGDITKTVSDSGEVLDIDRNDKEVNRVSAYDSDVLIDDTERETTGKDKHKKDIQGNVIQSKQGLNNVWDNLLSVDKVNIMDVIVKDVLKVLCISIY